MAKKLAAEKLAEVVKAMTDKWQVKLPYQIAIDQLKKDAEKASALREIIHAGKSGGINKVRQRVTSFLAEHGGALTTQQIIFLVLGDKDVAAMVKAALSEAGKAGVLKRGDQQKRVAFMAWARGAVKAGVSADTVNDLQGLEGFDSGWSSIKDPTLKKWAKAAGFVFKSGRPKKKNND